MGQSSWLVAGIVPGVERSPLKKLAVDESALLKLLNRWREEAEKAGHRIERIAIAFEAGRDGFWLARWLRARGIEAHVIHASSVAVSREHRRAKTDRLDTQLLEARLSTLPPGKRLGFDGMYMRLAAAKRRTITASSSRTQSPSEHRIAEFRTA